MLRTNSVGHRVHHFAAAALVAGSLSSCSGVTVYVDHIPYAPGYTFVDKTVSISGVDMRIELSGKMLEQTTYVLGIPFREKLIDAAPDRIVADLGFTSHQGTSLVQLAPGTLLDRRLGLSSPTRIAATSMGKSKLCYYHTYVRVDDQTATAAKLVVNQDEWTCAIVEFTIPGYQHDDALELILGPIDVGGKIISLPPISFSLGTRKTVASH